MKRSYTNSLFFILMTLLITPTMLRSQNKTGNIVEYFGKEKINEIHEGELVHVFDKGLVLSLNQIDDRSATFPKNPIFEEFLNHPDRRVQGNDLFGINYLGEEMRWEPVNTDSTHTFSGRELRSGYLYLEYESPRDEILLFEGSGHTQALINGLPHEGDHYDFGWSLIPVKIKKGMNTFMLSPGRFSRMRARLIRPESPVMLTSRDLTLPDLLAGEEIKYMGAVRLINSSGEKIENYAIQSSLNGNHSTTSVRPIAPLQVVKIPFEIPSDPKAKQGEQKLNIELQDKNGHTVSSIAASIQIKSKTKHHKRTFLSAIDGSVQYFSIAPSTDQARDSQALFLSVHGASVEAVNQANAYKQKDWGTLIAPTNRRPFGFAWEDWGRIDAMEVLKEAKKIYQPDPQKIYLTGHSMGGHGTWYLGATYPDRFAAIAPCSGYPDLLEYRNSFMQRRLRESAEMLKRFGISEKTIERMLLEPIHSPVEQMILRAGNPSRTLKLIRNYLQYGVYILHGEKDNVVPTYLAQDMRNRLGTFHPDFAYYEYPGGAHWFGNQSVDWPPIFDFFKRRTIPRSSEIDEFEFYTASPGVSSRSHFLEIHQQESPFEISNIKVNRSDSLYISTENVAALTIDAIAMGDRPDGLILDQQKITFPEKGDVIYLRKRYNTWKITNAFPKNEKGPHRNGGFKDAFSHHVVLVYATGGTPEENQWYFNRAAFDAEKFWYRANGNIPLIRDTDFKPGDYPDQNVILYGSRDNNRAWEKLLNQCPIQIGNGLVTMGEVSLKGVQWGTYFIYPREDSEIASVGVVSATGARGMKAAFGNQYLENGTTYPDFLLFDDGIITEGNPGVKCAGFFGNDWSVEKGDFEWR